jgi:hypothetical protein
MELAAVFAAHWGRFASTHRHLLAAAHYRAAEAVLSCRTAELGGQVHHCGDCQRQTYVYHSCNHRACPKCGGREQKEWAAAQEARLLRAAYFMPTFTLPGELRAFAYRHQRWFYDLLFRAMAQTLTDFAQDERHLGGTPGFTAVLHTWTREMGYHPHLHVIMPGLALSADGLRLRRPKGKRYLFNIHALGAAFRNRVRMLLEARDREEKTQHLQAIDPRVWRRKWNVNVQAVGRGKAAVRYMARYVHKTALSEQRLLGYDEAGNIRLNCQDSDTGRWYLLTLSVEEFLRRWCLHVLPKGLVRVRHYGVLSAAAKRKLERLHQILGTKSGEPRATRPAPKPPPLETPVPKCPCCGKEMTLLCVIKRPPRGRSLYASPPHRMRPARDPPATDTG